MTIMTGQGDAFDLLEDKPPVPPFTVHTCVWGTSQHCGWCGKNSLHGGGARRNPDNNNESWFYSYCGKCHEQYGHPNPGVTGTQIIIDRTQYPRPEGLPNLSGKNKEGG